MPSNDKFSLHRRQPGGSDRMITGEGPKEEMLARYLNIAPSMRSQYSLMQGFMEFNHLEIENMLANEKGSE